MSFITSNCLNPSLSFSIPNSIRTRTQNIPQNLDPSCPQIAPNCRQNVFLKGTKKWSMKKKGRFSNLRQGGVGAVSAVVQSENEEKQESLPMRFAVSISTQLLRVFSFGSSSAKEELPPLKLEEPAVGNVNVLEALLEDYKKAYFLTGDITTVLYADDCIFADPTIQFTGRDKYQRNLKLLVPLFEEPSLTLFSIQEEFEGDAQLIKAFWKLRTYLRLPWKPLIEVEGSTLYNINANSKIVKHVESWSISAKHALWQIFVPSDRAFWRRFEVKSDDHFVA